MVGLPPCLNPRGQTPLWMNLAPASAGLFSCLGDQPQPRLPTCSGSPPNMGWSNTPLQKLNVPYSGPPHIEQRDKRDESARFAAPPPSHGPFCLASVPPSVPHRHSLTSLMLRFGEECVPGAWGRCRGDEGSAQAASTGTSASILQSTTALSSGDGGREFIARFGAASVALPMLASAQQPAMPVIGFP